jgi:mRNA interferase MazF
MVRGAVAWVALDPARGAEVPKTRPCVVVSRTEANAVSPTITVVPLSSVRREPAERLVQPIVGVDESRRSRALCDQERTLDRSRIRRTAGTLSPQAMRRIDRGLILHLRLEGYVV